MAPDAPWPRRDAPGLTWASRELETVMHAGLFLLNYYAYAGDGGFDVPMEHFAPQASDETTEQYHQRRNAARLLKQTQALAGSWARLCAEELRHVRPSDAPRACGWICEQLARIMADAGGGSFVEVVTDAEPLLGPMCPPAHQATAPLIATDLLNAMMAGGLSQMVPTLERAARREPIAAIHLAAAMAAGAYRKHLDTIARATESQRISNTVQESLDTLSGKRRR